MLYIHSVLHKDQSVCFTFKVWSQSIYTCTAQFAGCVCVYVSMTVAINYMLFTFEDENSWKSRGYCEMYGNALFFFLAERDFSYLSIHVELESAEG